MEDATKKKVTIHTLDWVTKQGFVCKSSQGYRVAVGTNPFGPRGGLCGKLVEGKFVTGQLSSRKKAEEIAAAILKDLEGR